MTDVSICTPYFNRLEQLNTTLLSYLEVGYFNHPDVEVELSICDDGSNWHNRIPEEMKVQYVTSYIERKRDEVDIWLNPCVPLNQAVDQSSGKVLALTEPEVYHEEPVLFKMLDMIEDDKDVIVCPCKILGNKRAKWYAHPVHRNRPSWWFMLITRSFWDEIGGFDPIFRHSTGYDDDDFMRSVKKLEGNIKWADDLYVVHPVQQSKRSALKGKYVGGRKLMAKKWKTYKL